jgi:hypothetical protein
MSRPQCLILLLSHILIPLTLLLLLLAVNMTACLPLLCACPGIHVSLQQAHEYQEVTVTAAST